MSLFKTPSNDALVIFQKRNETKNVKKIKKYKNINIKV